MWQGSTTQQAQHTINLNLGECDNGVVWGYGDWHGVVTGNVYRGYHGHLRTGIIRNNISRMPVETNRKLRAAR